MDASVLSEQAIAHKISIAPGKMFTTGGAWHHYFRLNASWALGERENTRCSVSESHSKSN